MKKTLFIALFAGLSSLLPAQNNRYNIVFPPGKADLSTEQKKIISHVAASLSDGETVVFYPLAYDSVSDIYRYTNYAKEQAVLISDFAATEGFILVGMPRNFPSQYSGMSVSVIMKYSRPASPSLAEKNTGPVQTLQDHYPPKPSQFFIVNPDRDTTIVGNEGTRLSFRAGSLLTHQPVQIELKEFYRLDDYIKNGLPTVSNGQMIQTGGSIYLNAKELNNSKKQVQINPQKGVGAEFTLGKNDPDMQIFIKDPRSAQTLNWILPPKRYVRESWQLTETVYDHNDKVVSETKYDTKEAWEQHLKEEKEKERLEKERQAELRKQEEKRLAEQKRLDNIRQATNAKMDHQLEIFNLGYINCDKFSNEPKTLFTCSGDEKVVAEYYLVYTDIRGVMKGQVNGQQVSFGSIAQNREAVLIAVSFTGKQAYYFKAGVAAGGRLTSKVTLQPVDENFLNQQLALLK
jgi:hypothetical protein